MGVGSLFRPEIIDMVGGLVEKDSRPLSSSLPNDLRNGLLIVAHYSTDDLVVEVVDRHTRIDNEGLSIDAT